MRISIVTAVYNGERYLEDCIKSIMQQDYDDYEHIIVDGGSTDATLNIIKKYDGKYNMRWISESDNGMYDAICKGFDMATGDIFAWLNYDDMYYSYTFQLINAIFENYGVQWCTGFPVVLSPSGIMHALPKAIPVYYKPFMKMGLYGFSALGVQQESTFWSKKLWEKAKGNEIKKYKMAGDYFLWKKFGHYENLYVLDAPVAGFRRHPGQKSGNILAYRNEIGKMSVFMKIMGKIANQISYYSGIHGIHAIKTANSIAEIEESK